MHLTLHVGEASYKACLWSGLGKGYLGCGAKGWLFKMAGTFKIVGNGFGHGGVRARMRGDTLAGWVRCDWKLCGKGCQDIWFLWYCGLGKV